MPQSVGYEGTNCQDTFCIGTACAANYLFTRVENVISTIAGSPPGFIGFAPAQIQGTFTGYEPLP
jgi:hypothetical protein